MSTTNPLQPSARSQGRPQRGNKRNSQSVASAIKETTSMPLMTTALLTLNLPLEVPQLREVPQLQAVLLLRPRQRIIRVRLIPMPRPLLPLQPPQLPTSSEAGVVDSRSTLNSITMTMMTMTSSMTTKTTSTMKTWMVRWRMASI